jgi:hypothetical protein
LIKIVIDDEEEKALSPEAEELLQRRAAEVGFSALDWIVQLLELHAEQDEEDEPEHEE